MRLGDRGYGGVLPFPGLGRRSFARGAGPCNRHAPRKEGRMTTKRQQTMAKRERELAVRERRARKLEKKHAAAAERKARAAGESPLDEGQTEIASSVRPE